MIKFASRFTTLLILLFTILGYAQDKKKFSSIPNILQRIEPDDKIDSWVLVYNSYGKGEEIKVSGGKISYTPSSQDLICFPARQLLLYSLFFRRKN